MFMTDVYLRCIKIITWKPTKLTIEHGKIDAAVFRNRLSSSDLHSTDDDM